MCRTVDCFSIIRFYDCNLYFEHLGRTGKRTIAGASGESKIFHRWFRQGSASEQNTGNLMIPLILGQISPSLPVLQVITDLPTAPSLLICAVFSKPMQPISISRHHAVVPMYLSFPIDKLFNWIQPFTYTLRGNLTQSDLRIS